MKSFIRLSKQLSLILAALVLFASCSKYEILNTNSSYFKFSYKEYKEFVSKTKSTEYMSNKDLNSLVDYVEFRNTIPIEIQKLFQNSNDIEYIKSKVVELGILSSNEIYLLIKFSNDYNNYGIEKSLLNFEKGSNIFKNYNVDFSKQEKLANLFKITDETTTILKSSSGTDCLIKYIIWLGSVIAFVTGCATVFLCGLGAALLLYATVDLVATCGTWLEETK